MKKRKMKIFKRAAAFLFAVAVAVMPTATTKAAYNLNGLTINENIQTINSESRHGKNPRYIVVHYTGSTGTAYNNTVYFKTAYRGSSAHYFVGYEGEVWQSTADNRAAWSVGGKKYPGTAGGKYYGKVTNYNSINVEMCVKTKGSTSDTSKDWYFQNATINSTVKLVQGLMKKYNIPIQNVIRHYDVVGKYCPNPFVLNDDTVKWDDFKRMVAGDQALPPNAGSSEGEYTETSENVNVYYAVETKKYGKLPEVKNNEDYAGWGNDPITNVKIRVDKGSVKYRVHTGGRWLPYVTGANWNDYQNGYAGNGKEIDAIEVYYYTPNSIRPYKKAVYRVAPVNRGYYPYQYDNETDKGQDGYAGAFGNSIQKLQITIQ